MASSRKEKHDANSRARRHSLTSHSKKRKKDRDGDTESVTSSSNSSTDTAIAEAKCPLRFLLSGIMEEGEGTEPKKGGCPLRRVQLWHVIPLCILAIINLLLVIVALLGLAGYQIIMGVQRFVVNVSNIDLDRDPYDEAIAGSDTKIIIVSENSGKII